MNKNPAECGYHNRYPPPIMGGGMVGEVDLVTAVTMIGAVTVNSAVSAITTIILCIACIVITTLSTVNATSAVNTLAAVAGVIPWTGLLSPGGTYSRVCRSRTEECDREHQQQWSAKDEPFPPPMALPTWWC